MFTDILAVLLASYKISISPKDFTRFKMDNDEEETQNQWHEYLDEEYTYEDFFEKEETIIFPNPICVDCNIETFSLVTEDKTKTLSKCPKCKHSYITHN